MRKRTNYSYSKRAEKEFLAFGDTEGAKIEHTLRETRKHDMRSLGQIKRHKRGNRFSI